MLLKKVRIHQVGDLRQQRLLIRLERFAPLVERLEFEGYRRTGFSAWNRPLFYRRKK